MGSRIADQTSGGGSAPQRAAGEADGAPGAEHLRGAVAGVNAVIGKLVGVTGQSEPVIECRSAIGTTPVRARTTVPVREADIGRQAVLLFEEGDPQKPIVMGLLEVPQVRTDEDAAEQRKLDIATDGERLVFTAKREIVLRCGKATIVLTRAGKILLRGAYLLNRSSGVNRIKGGSVQIN